MFFGRVSAEENESCDERRHLRDYGFLYDACTTTSVQEMRRSLLESCFPGGGMGSGCLSLLTTAVTPSMLALPLAFSIAGLSFAIVCIFFCIIVTIISVRILAHASVLAASDDYESVAGFFLGAKGRWLVRSILLFYNFGSSVVYLCFLNDIVRNIITVKGSFLPTWLQGNLGSILALILFVACVTPLTFNSRLASLRTMGFASNIMTTFIVLSIVYRFFVPLAPRGELGLIMQTEVKETHRSVARWEPILPYLFTVSIFVFSYEVQSNVMDVIKDLDDRTGESLLVCICLALAMATALYLPLGIFGSLSFPHMIKGDILDLYDIKQDNLMFFCQVLCCFSAATSYVFGVFPCRFAVFMFLSDGTTSRVSKRSRVRIGIALAIIGAGCAILLPDVSKVVALLGALFSSTLSMTLPALFALKMKRSRTHLTSALDSFLSWALLLLGVLLSLGGSLVAVMDVLGLADLLRT
ncbi:amino acid permease aap11ld-like protein [Trypanosoma rangeli]|uniref:Amino acid permease aap11ld-like protein n=1 Tax=Trypanosoma rangeli TaxID=5698 RepID=A0A3R7MQD8_TRYRA|nr:amino acid permease aap11ld-like protein [Trypanosoma rangeli]RNF09593.1 amino acid permease aap11ld-like protein [Trypanosoma rangeli]|eukprot:RNF09593.1 amino acid permease aap11ld-like protein [Trypanosoma rangeli]